MLKSNTLHKFVLLLLMLMLTLMLGWVCSYPVNNQAEDVPSGTPRSILLIQNNVRPEHAKDYQIIIPKDVKPGEPCLTIKWKTNPDGSGPADPTIYMLKGYFHRMPPTANQQQ